MTILPEATNIVSSANKDHNKLPSKTCNGILKKTGTSEPKKFGVPHKVTSFADEKVINVDIRPNIVITNGHSVQQGKAIVDSSNKSTVRVTISSYPDSTIQPNRFAVNHPANLKKNLTTRVTLNGCD